VCVCLHVNDTDRQWPVHDDQLHVNIFTVFVQEVRHEVRHRLVRDVTTQDDMPAQQTSPNPFFMFSNAAATSHHLLAAMLLVLGWFCTELLYWRLIKLQKERYYCRRLRTILRTYDYGKAKGTPKPSFTVLKNNNLEWISISINNTTLKVNCKRNLWGLNMIPSLYIYSSRG